MQYTLLDIVQSVLSSMDSDEVDSISDTVESQQVVQIVKTVYDEIVTRSNLAITKTLFNLTASTDGAKPVLMTKPSNIDSIDWLRYNKTKATDTSITWGDIQYLPLDSFVMAQQSLNTSETNVDSFTHTINGFTFTFNYRTDIAPCYYTSFDDNTLIFDAYDSSVDSTLQSIKTLAFGPVTNVFVEDSTWVPNLSAEQFSLLINEAKSLAWAELKQTSHAKAEQSARRGWRHLAHKREHTHDLRFLKNNHSFDELPNFGRKSGKY